MSCYLQFFKRPSRITASAPAVYCPMLIGSFGIFKFARMIPLICACNFSHVFFPCGYVTLYIVCYIALRCDELLTVFLLPCSYAFLDVPDSVLRAL